jgi:hypothetical protein
MDTFYNNANKQPVMKKLIFTLTVLCITIPTLTYGQIDKHSKTSIKNDSVSLDWEWAPLGAVWMYTTTGMSGNTYWYVYSEKDTLFNGKECRKLKVEIFEKTSNDLLEVNYRYTYQEAEKIYMYSFGEGEFQQLYDYTASHGDTVRIYCPLAPENCFGDYIVDSVIERMPGGWPNPTYPLCETNTKINTFHMDYLTTAAWCGVLYPNASVGTYVSYAGSVTTDMCYVFEAGYNEEVFDCYYDGHVNIFRTQNDSCLSYYQQHLDIKQNNLYSKIEISPNPVENSLNITIKSEIGGQLKIYNFSGKLIYQSELNSENHTVNFEKYTSGLYIVTVSSGGHLFKKKIIKTKAK